MKRRAKQRRRLSRATRATLGWWLGWLLAAAGVFLVLGLGFALIVFGLAMAGTFLLVYDVGEPEREEVRFR